MKHLIKKLFRDVRASIGQYIAIILVVLLGVAFYVGLTSASVGVRANVEKFYDDQKLADLWVNGAFDENAIDKIRSLKDVMKAGGRRAFTVTEGDSEFTSHTLIDGINSPFIELGRSPQNENECIVDRGYYDTNHLKIGQSLGGYKIVGVFNSPEYLYMARNISESATHEHYGAIFVGGEANLYNEIDVIAKPGSDIAELKNEIKTAIPQSIIIDRTKLFSWFMLNDDIEQFGKIGSIFPVVFFLVASAIIFISMSKNVEIQRGQIGNMKALGIKKSVITLHFLSYTIFTCLIGCLIGALTGVFAFMPWIQRVFTALYTMPALTASGFALNIAVASILAFAFGIIATFVSIRGPLAESPASAMRPKVPKNVKPILLERSDMLWSKLSFGRKIVLRNLFLNKGRAILSSVGIVGCIGLMLAAFSFHDVFELILNEKFYEMNQYDIVVSLKNPLDTQFLLNDANTSSIWATGSAPASFESGAIDVTTDLIALEPNSSAIALYDKQGQRLKIPTDGVIVPKLYSDKYSLAVGETLALTLTPIIGEPHSVNVKITAIAMEYLGQDIYTSFDYLEAIGENLPVSSYYLNLKDSAKAEEYSAILKANDQVKLSMTLNDISNGWAQSMNIMNAMISVLIVAASILSMTVVYNISAINILERRRDVATLKVLGYHRAEVNRLVFQENLLVTGFASVLGIGAGYAFLWLILEFVMSDEMMVPLRITPLSIVYAIALGFAFTIIANQMLRGKIRRIDMVESLKSVE